MSSSSMFNVPLPWRRRLFTGGHASGLQMNIVTSVDCRVHRHKVQADSQVDHLCIVWLLSSS